MSLTPEIEQVLNHRTELILAGIQRRDMSDVLGLYAEDALYSPAGDCLLASRAALSAYWNSVLESPARDAALEVVRVDRLAPDAFLEIQRYDVFDAGGCRLFGGYASLLWRKLGGRWRISADVSNG